jgi:hypothetical protein
MGRWAGILLFGSLLAAGVPSLAVAQTPAQGVAEGACDDLRSRRITGKVSCTASGGGRFEGTMQSGMFETGTYKWPNGDVYGGEWLNNRPHGKGYFHWADGRIYEGDLVEGKLQGRGKHWSASGNFVYNGEFRNGEYDGWGVGNLISGSRYEGYWRSNLPNGQGTMFGADGTVDSGVWLNGCLRTGNMVVGFLTTRDRC